MAIHFYSQPLAFPTPEEYQAQYMEYEDRQERLQQKRNHLFYKAPGAEWNAWADVMREVVASKPKRNYYDPTNELHYKMMSIQRVSMSFEHYDDLVRSERAIDVQTRMGLIATSMSQSASYYSYHHAFAQGYLQQQRITDQMYDGQIPFYQTFTMVGEALDAQPLLQGEDSRELHELFNQRVRNLGQRGLDAMDYARGYIEKWAHEVYPNSFDNAETKRDAFRMGHGAALFGARAYHAFMNDLLMPGLKFDMLSPEAFITKNSSISTREK